MFLILILYKNITSDIRKNKNIKPIFDVFSFSVFSDFGLEKEKVLHLNLLDSAQNKIGSLQVIGFKTVAGGEKSAFIQFKYVDKDGNEFLAMQEGPKNKAQLIENGKNITYQVSYVNQKISSSVKVRNHLFEIFNMRIDGVKFYEIINKNSRKLELL